MNNIEASINAVEILLNQLNFQIEPCDFPFTGVVAFIKKKNQTCGTIFISEENPDLLNYYQHDVYNMEESQMCIHVKVESPDIYIDSFNPISENIILNCREEEREWIVKLEDGQIQRESPQKVKRIGGIYESD